MKIKKVSHNNRKKCFEVVTAKGRMEYPDSRLRLKPTENNPIQEVFVDSELGDQGFTYKMQSGKEDSILLDQVLKYNKDSDYMREMLLYKLTIQAQKILTASHISKREVIRRLGTSPTQFYRLLDQTFYGKTIDQMVKLLAALDCSVDLTFTKAA